MRLPALIASLACLAAPAFAQEGATCAAVSTDASILASPDWGDLHADWSDGSTVGLAWTFVPYGEEEAGGEWFMYGDLLDADGGLHSTDVYVSVMEWECDVYE